MKSEKSSQELLRSKIDKRRFESLTNLVRNFILVGILAVIFRAFLWEPFFISSGSMKPTLLVGDVLISSKHSHGISKYSIPFSLSIFNGKIFDRVAHLGDVVVFRPSHQPSQNWIKRIVGLPCDRIQIIGGLLYINGTKCHLERTEDFFIDSNHHKVDNSHDKREHINQYIQSLPNGVRHTIIKRDPFGEGNSDDTPFYIVPKECYFVMGDNRDDSDDSRSQYSLGFISHEKVLGKAKVILFSSEVRWWEIWKWRVNIRFKRLINPIQ